MSPNPAKTTRTKTRERVQTVAFMMGLTAAAITVVSGLQVVTAERIRRNDGLYAQRAVLMAADIEAPQRAEELAARFERDVETLAAGPDAAAERYRVHHPDGRTLHVRQVRGTGLWGTIRAMVGFDPQAETLSGIAFLEHNETPGLGARIEETWFRAQFAGLRRGADGAPITYHDEQARDLGPHAFNGITGATTTTRAVADIVNRALED